MLHPWERRHRSPRARVVVVPVAGLLTGLLGGPWLVGCGADESSDATVATIPVEEPADCRPSAPVLRVDLIDEAIAAVEDDLGAPAQYFEINATALLVNLFVANGTGDAEGTTVTPYVYVDGAVTSTAASAATGSAFAAEAIDIEPDLVTACVSSELTGSVQDAFVIEGGPNGVVRYSVVVTSSAGGQLVVGVDGSGHVLSVDPV